MANYAFDVVAQARALQNELHGSASSNSYAGMLKAAQGQYQKILGGYQKALRGQAASQRAINAGYNQLQANVLGGLAASGTARSQEIADYYTEQSGRAQQQLVDRGLGNTTVASSLGARYNLDQAKAQTDLADKLANTRAGYQSQLGLAGLGYRDQANRQRAAIQGQQLGYMGDWQRTLAGLGMQGMNMSSRGGGSYSGGGRYGGGIRSSGYNPYGPMGAALSDSLPATGEDRINMNLFAGGGLPMGGRSRPQTTYIGGGGELSDADYDAAIWDLAGGYA